MCHDIGEVPEGSNGEETVEADQEINVRRVAAPSQAAVVSVLCLRSSLFIVQVSSWNLFSNGFICLLYLINEITQVSID